jgi:hypothetical protein
MKQFLAIFVVLGFVAGTPGCAARLSPGLRLPPSSAGLAVLECYLYPQDPGGVRPKFASRDSFPASVAYLESVANGHLVRGFSIYGTGYVLFPNLAPGKYRLGRVSVETSEYSMARSRMVATEYKFLLPESTKVSVQIERGTLAYLGILSIRRLYTREDVTRSVSYDPMKLPNAHISLERSKAGEARALRTLLAQKKYRRTAWREPIENRLAAIENE